MILELFDVEIFKIQTWFIYSILGSLCNHFFAAFFHFHFIFNCKQHPVPEVRESWVSTTAERVFPNTFTLLTAHQNIFLCDPEGLDHILP